MRSHHALIAPHVRAMLKPRVHPGHLKESHRTTSQARRRLLPHDTPKPSPELSNNRTVTAIPVINEDIMARAPVFACSYHTEASGAPGIP